jgi:SnoaL-like protein
MSREHGRETRWRRWSVIAGVLPLVLGCGPAGSRAAIEKVVADYVGLYAAPTLDRWKSLFHPRLTVVFPAEDGTIRVRSLEEFFAAQKDYFATGRKIGERLENVRIDVGRRIARVSADFVFVDEGEESRGRLGLHLAEGKDGWRIVAIIFSYDQP